MKQRHIFWIGILGLCVLLSASGCGSGNVKGGGTVSFPDGTPVQSGTVVFANDLHQFTGTIQANGTFRLGGLRPGDGLPPGTYRVAVIEVYENEVAILDDRFESFERSSISFDVVRGNNEPFAITVERSSVSRAPPPPREGSYIYVW